MSSQYSRGQLVTDALALAGRGNELRGSCNQWLNYWLRKVGLTFRFPELRKIGASATLAMGTNVASLPADFGAGMDKQGMIFGPNNKPLDEFSFEDFSYNNGFPATSATGLPQFYIVDREAGNFRFDRTADKAYAFTPVYFKQPPLLDVATSADNSSIWLDNDELALQGLIATIYQFTHDERELTQKKLVDGMLLDWKRETTKLGGTSRVMPSPRNFKRFHIGTGWPNGC